MFTNAEPKLWSSAEHVLKKITISVSVHLTCSWRRPTSFSICENTTDHCGKAGSLCWNWPSKYFHPSSSLSSSLPRAFAYFFLLPSAAAFYRYRKWGLAAGASRGNASWPLGGGEVMVAPEAMRRALLSVPTRGGWRRLGQVRQGRVAAAGLAVRKGASCLLEGDTGSEKQRPDAGVPRLHTPAWYDRSTAKSGRRRLRVSRTALSETSCWSTRWIICFSTVLSPR